MAEAIRAIGHGTATAVVPGSHAVVVMAKAPISGAVKSRLVPPLTEDEAAALNRCFISDVCASIEAAAAIVAAGGNAGVASEDACLTDGEAGVADGSASIADGRANVGAIIACPPAGAPPAPIVAAAGNATVAGVSAGVADLNAGVADGKAKVVGMIAYTPAGAQAAFDGLVPASFKFIEQRGDGLTARLINVAADLLATGYESVSLMNSDSPTIPQALIADAVAGLARAGDRLAIIGADDGGYCLIGLKRPHWRVFEEIAWSTDAVLVQTLQRAAESRLDVLRSPSWYDVDEAASLRRLIGELFSNQPPSENRRSQNQANPFAAPATRAGLSEALANGLAARLGLAPIASPR